MAISGLISRTPPWQLGEAQEPGPVNFGGSGDCANVRTEHTSNRRPVRIAAYSVLEDPFPGNTNSIVPAEKICWGEA